MAIWKNKYELLNVTPFQTKGISGDAVRHFIDNNNIAKINAAEINGKIYTDVKLMHHSFLSNVLLFNQEIKDLERGDNNTVVLYEEYVNEPTSAPEPEPEPTPEPNPGGGGTDMSNYIWDNKIDAVGCPLYADWLRVNVGLTREQCSQINAVEYQGKVYMLTKVTRSTSGTDRTMISFKPKIPVGSNSTANFTVYFNYRKNPIEWREVTLKKTIGMTTVRKTDPNMYKGEERVIEGHAGQETITVEREYKNGKWTGSERNRRSKITIEMVPRQIITGTKEPIEWKPKEEIKYVEITTERMQETDPDIYEDEEKTVPGTRGEIKVTWEEKYEGGKATGETRNRKETVIVEMVPNRIYKGGKHRPVITLSLIHI